jgi:hypothetical protein
MKKTLLMVSMAIFLLFPLQLLAAEGGKVTGTFVVDKDQVQLKHGYAYLYDNEEGWESAKEMRILLSENPVGEEIVTETEIAFKLSDLMKEGKLRGVLILFDPAKTDSIRLTTYYPSIGVRGNKSIQNSSKSPIEGLEVTDRRVKGKLTHEDEGSESFGWPPEKYEVSFDLPLMKAPAVTATLTGAKALKAPQTVALLAKFTAFVNGDMKKVKENGTDNSNRTFDDMMAKASESEKAQLRQMIKEEIASIKKGDLRLVERGDKATLIVSIEGGKSKFEFMKINGKWKSD